jgi:hypothetical protein
MRPDSILGISVLLAAGATLAVHALSCDTKTARDRQLGGLSACPSLRDPPQPPFPTAIRRGASGVHWEPIEQPFWTRHRVFRIRHGFPPLFGLTVAVDPERRVIRLTNDRPLGRSNPALVCFNEISRREGVVMNRGNVEAYLAFFLEVHLGRPGRFLPGRQEAEIAANLAQYSFLPKRLLEVLEKPKRPRVEVLRWQSRFHAQAYAWDAPRGTIHEYQIVASDREVVSFEERFFGAHPVRLTRTAGTCFAVSTRGLVLTAQHVVANAFSISVRFPGGDPFEAEIEATWPQADLALLEIHGRVPGTLALALESLPEPGAGVFTLGLPPPVSGEAEPEYVEGEIVERYGDTSFVTTLRVRGGFSGAPVVNHRGKVVGVLSQSREWGADARSLAVEPRLAYRLLRRPEPLTPTAGLGAAIARARRALCAVDVESIWRSG